jgi:small-conductance mechanosensitive channel
MIKGQNKIMPSKYISFLYPLFYTKQSDYLITPFLKTLQMGSISVRIKHFLYNVLHDLAPTYFSRFIIFFLILLVNTGFLLVPRTVKHTPASGLLHSPVYRLIMKLFSQRVLHQYSINSFRSLIKFHLPERPFYLK